MSRPESRPESHLESHPVMTAASLAPADHPTLHFVGVTTGSSSIQGVFPRWARLLDLGGARLQGVDLPVHAPREDYRRVVEHIAADPLSRGALVTTHKLDLHRAARDLFAAVDPYAELMGETSCLSKPASAGGGLAASAKDPVSAGLALEALVPAGHWEATGAEAVITGAGGSAVAISWYLGQASRGADRPGRITVTDTSEQRLEHLVAVHDALEAHVPVEPVLVSGPEGNDRAVAAAPPGSLVVNATGLGKDAPGSPLSAAARFPEGGLAWDLNYRGELVFLDQARAQAERRSLVVEDGWTYFLHGWGQVVGEVFGIEVPTAGPGFEALARAAGAPQ